MVLKILSQQIVGSLSQKMFKRILVRHGYILRSIFDFIRAIRPSIANQPCKSIG
ncbi:MAG: hypothetical protein GC136_11310 [Alphaproteobacteria bacterium]|nr:hypothetical protein [Alphaproteobacteria bacterium]